MGVLDRFERGVERAVNGAFAKAFRSSVEPIELGAALCKEADRCAALVDRNRTLAPNAYTISLSPDDFERFHKWQAELSEELAAVLTDHARRERYSFVGPVMIRFREDGQLPTGMHEVESEQMRGKIAPAATGAIATTRHPVLDVNGRHYQLSNRTTVIGRGGDADLVLDDTGVSREHVRLIVDNGQLLLEDLGSTNGTFVNGQQVTQWRLMSGDRITVGHSVLTVLTGINEDGGI